MVVEELEKLEHQPPPVQALAGMVGLACPLAFQVQRRPMQAGAVVEPIPRAAQVAQAAEAMARLVRPLAALVQLTRVVVEAGQELVAVAMAALAS